MQTISPVFVVLDLCGVLAFAVNGALTALRTTRLDIVGVVTLATFTALGGGMVRDIVLGDLPPASFMDWRYLAVAGAGGLTAFVFGRRLDRLSGPITVLDAAGLSLFAVVGAAKALDFGMGPAQAIILGTVTAVGGGTLRDVLVREVPTVLTSDLYAIPAMLGAAVLVGLWALGATALLAATIAAGSCFALRLVGVRMGLQAPRPRA